MQTVVFFVCLAGVSLLVLFISARGMYWRVRIKDRPRWELGLAVQPLRWSVAIVVSLYRIDRGFEIGIGPISIYLHAGATLTNVRD